MLNLIQPLILSCDPNFLLTHYDIMISLSIDPSDFLETQALLCKLIDFVKIFL